MYDFFEENRDKYHQPNKLSVGPQQTTTESNKSSDSSHTNKKENSSCIEDGYYKVSAH